MSLRQLLVQQELAAADEAFGRARRASADANDSAALEDDAHGGPKEEVVATPETEGRKAHLQDALDWCASLFGGDVDCSSPTPEDEAQQGSAPAADLQLAAAVVAARAVAVRVVVARVVVARVVVARPRGRSRITHSGVTTPRGEMTGDDGR